MADRYRYYLEEAQAEDLLQHLIATLHVSGLSHVHENIVESLALLAPTPPEEGQESSFDETYPVKSSERLLYYLGATIEYLQQTSSHQVEQIRKRINEHLSTDNKVERMVVEYSDMTPGAEVRQVDLADLPNYSELLGELLTLQEQLNSYIYVQ